MIHVNSNAYVDANDETIEVIKYILIESVAANNRGNKNSVIS